MNEQLEQVMKEALSDAELSPAELPRIDLYLDQILNLVSEKKEEGSDRYQERVLTKTMINNYSKEGAILPLKGKKYDRRQVLQILFIDSLKNSLSIGEIKRLFDVLKEDGTLEEKEFEQLYVDYLGMKESGRRETERITEETVERLSLDPSKDEDYIRLILSVAALSSYLETLAKTMIDVRFPEKEPTEKTKKKKSEKVAEKAEALSEKAEKVAVKAEKVAAKAERIAEKESERERKKSKK